MNIILNHFLKQISEIYSLKEVTKEIKDLKNFVKEEQTKIPNQEKNIDLVADWNFSGDVKFNDEED